MTGFSFVYNLARADFLERIRRFSFLVVLGVTVVFGYTLVPSTSAPYNGFVMYGCRGIYNSAWIGTIVGYSVTSLLSLIGFYLVKDAVSRDYQTRVGQIIATTPISKFEYMIGKWLSNLTVLTLIIAILTVIAVVMQLIRGEDSSLNIWKLAAPIWFMSLPVLAWVSALALFFETVPLFRGTLGYVAYLTLWAWLLIAATIGPMFDSPVDVISNNDFMGVSESIADMSRSMVAQGIDISKGETDIYQPTSGKMVEHFNWSGVNWGIAQISGRLLWLGASFLVVLLTAIPFDRFDPARRRLRVKLRGNKKKRRKKDTADIHIETESKRIKEIGFTQLTPLEEARASSRLWAITLLEMKLLLVGKGWWWYAGALGLIISSLVVPSKGVRMLLFAIAWAWPTMVWSQMGNRQRRFQTETLVFTAASSIRRQLPAAWIAGTLVALIMGSGYGFRLLMSSSYNLFISFIVGAMFVSALALASGVWTNGGRTFQIFYPVLCYLGLSGGFVWFDYKGVNSESAAAGAPIMFFFVTVVLLILTVLGRQRQMKRN